MVIVGEYTGIGGEWELGATWEAIAIMWRVIMVWTGSDHGCGKKASDSGYRVGLTGFSHALDVGYKRKRGVKNDFRAG